jgi:alkanesulfonate monooxygenase SsuD/methylene tetrahydromethanopterin reductase-like flavin-dependent oxidoreductase (luciferase family)
MDLAFYLPAHWHDVKTHPVQMYRDMLVEARHAEELGYSSLHIPEHHFLNYLVHPHPLITAARVAGETKKIPLVTAVLVLPFYDVRRLAGEIALCDNLTEGRLELGVGRGAFLYEFDRFGITVDEGREKFEESLALLKKLLTEEEVSWDGKFYKFPPLTITPRCLQQPHPPIWIACVTAPAIYHSARKGYHVMVMPLRTMERGPEMQAEAFYKAKAEIGAGFGSRLSMLIFCYVAADRADAEEKIRICYTAQKRFQNAFTTPGDIRGGDIQPNPIELPIETFAERVAIGTPEEVYEKLKYFADLGADEVLVNMNFGCSHKDTMASMERLARHIMPRLKSAPAKLVG